MYSSFKSLFEPSRGDSEAEHSSADSSNSLILSRIAHLKEILQVESCETALQLLKQSNCQSNSRLWLHHKVDDWLAEIPIEEDVLNSVFCLPAGAGMGKSVYCASLVERLAHKEQSQLLAVVFVNEERLHSPLSVLKSLTFQIGKRYPESIDFIINKIELLKKNSETFAEYFDGIFVPLINLIEELNSESMSNHLMVIDGIDEIDNEDNELLLLLDFEYLQKLPSWLKIFITCRPIPAIDDKLFYNSYLIDKCEEWHTTDIKEFVWYNVHQYLDDDTEVSVACDLIMNKCENNFLCASLMVKVVTQIEGSDSIMKQIDELPDGLDEYYRRIFKNLFTLIGSIKCQQLLLILVSCLEPLSKTELQYLLCMESDSEEYELIIKHIDVVFPLREVKSDNGAFVSKFLPVHKSAVEWLTSKANGIFYCDINKGHRLFSKRLLHRIGIDVRVDETFNQRNIKISSKLLTTMTSYSTEQYLFKHLLTHLDNSTEIVYQHVTHHLLTNLSWIQCSLSLFGISSCIQQYSRRSVDSNWLPLVDGRSDITVFQDFLLTLVDAIEKDPLFDWRKEICTQILHYRINNDKFEILRTDAKAYIDEHGGWLIQLKVCDDLNSSQYLSICVLRDGRIVTSSKTTIKVWSVDDKTIDFEWKAERVTHSCVLSDGRVAMMSSTGYLEIWTINSKTLHQNFKGKVYIFGNIWSLMNVDNLLVIQTAAKSYLFYLKTMTLKPLWENDREVVGLLSANEIVYRCAHDEKCLVHFLSSGESKQFFSKEHVLSVEKLSNNQIVVCYFCLEKRSIAFTILDSVTLKFDDSNISPNLLLQSSRISKHLHLFHIEPGLQYGFRIPQTNNFVFLNQEGNLIFADYVEKQVGESKGTSTNTASDDNKSVALSDKRNLFLNHGLMFVGFIALAMLNRRR